MLPKNRRISKKIFTAISRSKGKIIQSPFLTAKIIKKERECEGKSFFSFVVSGKVSKKAVERNLLRRRGYAAVRLVSKNIQPCFVCVFYFKKPALSLSYKKLEGEITTILKNTHVLPT